MASVCARKSWTPQTPRNRAMIDTRLAAGRSRHAAVVRNSDYFGPQASRSSVNTVAACSLRWWIGLNSSGSINRPGSRVNDSNDIWHKLIGLHNFR